VNIQFIVFILYLFLYSKRARVQIRGPRSLFTIKRRNNTLWRHALYKTQLLRLFDFSSGVQGWSPGRGSGGRSPPVTSKFYAFFGSNSHTIYEIETLIIENENDEAQLQSANSAPIRTTFIQRMKKMSKTAGTPNVHVSLRKVSELHFADWNWRLKLWLNCPGRRVSGLFAPRSESSQWEPSLPGTKVLRTFAPGNEGSHWEPSFPGANVPGNFRSWYSQFAFWPR